MSGIPPIGMNPSVVAGLSPSKASKPTSTDEQNPFQKLLQQTDKQQKSSDDAIQQLLEGKADSVHQVVLAVAKAEMSFQLFMEIRNKLIESYNDLMRMQF